MSHQRTAFDALTEAMESPVVERMLAVGARPSEYAGALINALRSRGFRITPIPEAVADDVLKRHVEPHECPREGPWSACDFNRFGPR